ncbi:DUF2335 domain-containing protein [Flavobacterium salilacus subsp. salilacus]|uniref:DUF2335 domain-containing protein n=1 Tax=Flavobacterium TaxID=237 RepID=UPI0010753F29|nr:MULTISPECIES: DUF2335 domain-containing protein [Flavobacterium]KAF2515080.1 DUF2335 domain-containing protein [Flavobacterium salilacus subsp. salilacus]MBE1615872.1 DUF2335 domain-containing protein [Flavobacterium sp. SaA2.13]
MAKEHSEKQLKPDNASDKLEISDIEQEITAVNPNLFQGINPKKKAEILQTINKAVSITAKHHSGPLPDSETMIEYNSVIPNGADRIMIMAEKQQDHRISMENKVVGHQLKESSRGQLFGFILSIISLLVSGILAYTGHETTGGIIGGATIISLAGIFVLGRFKSDRKKKYKDTNED